MLAAAYPLGALVGAIPSGIVAARFGVKPTVLVGLTVVAVTTALFGLASDGLAARPRPLLPGPRELVLVDGRARLARRRGAGRARAGQLIGQAFAAAVGGALLGPVLGGIAVDRGHRLDVRRRRDRLARARRLGVRRRRPRRPSEPQPLGAARRRARATGGCCSAIWFVVLPALLFGTLGVLAPLRLSALGFGAVAIGAIWLFTGALETGNNVLIGRALRPARAARADPRRAVGDGRSSRRSCRGRDTAYVLAVADRRAAGSRSAPSTRRG